MLLALLALACVSLAAPQEMLINLPGAPASLPYEVYGGTIAVAPGRYLYFTFVTCANDTAGTAPVVQFENGGPGCSSIGGGLLSECGPLWPTSDNRLKKNEFSWNSFANLLFVESPAGVGFSYSNNPADYTTGDVRTANDSYAFLLAFFELFPEYADRPYWITGESYGGHYTVELAQRIYEGNAQGNAPINLVGLAVGNAWTDAPLDNEGCVLDWWSHTINSQSTYEGLMKSCNFSAIGPLAEVPEALLNDCNHYLDKSTKEMGNVNIYDIYEHVCASSFGQAEALYRAIAAAPHSNPHVLLARAMHKRASLLGAFHAVSCIGNYVQTYLNLAEVQTAIHAPELPYGWTDCTTRVTYSYADVLTSVLPVYDYLFTTPLRILVYSGDVDGIVPTPSTKNWLAKLNLTETASFRPWTDSAGQVGGYVTEYQQMTFATVRNAGHMVPGTEPRRSHDLIARFVAGQSI